MDSEFIRDVLYQLKLDYGAPATYFVMGKNEFDPQTGRINLQRTAHQIKKLITLPSNVLRKVIQDIAYLAANKNFTYGAFFDENTTIVMLEKKTLPRGVIPSLNDFIVSGNQRFTIKKIENLTGKAGYILALQGHNGATPFREIQQIIKSDLRMEQAVLNG
jgi:hypothetical protein